MKDRTRGIIELSLGGVLAILTSAIFYTLKETPASEWDSTNILGWTVNNRSLLEIGGLISAFFTGFAIVAGILFLLSHKDQAQSGGDPKPYFSNPQMAPRRQAIPLLAGVVLGTSLGVGMKQMSSPTSAIQQYSLEPVAGRALIGKTYLLQRTGGSTDRMVIVAPGEKDGAPPMARVVSLGSLNTWVGARGPNHFIPLYEPIKGFHPANPHAAGLTAVYDQQGGLAVANDSTVSPTRALNALNFAAAADKKDVVPANP